MGFKKLKSKRTTKEKREKERRRVASIEYRANKKHLEKKKERMIEALFAENAALKSENAQLKEQLTRMPQIAIAASPHSIGARTSFTLFQPATSDTSPQSDPTLTGFGCW
jgi:hypothetical protein